MEAVLTLNNAENKWDDVVAYMQQGTLNPAAFSSWIAPLKPHRLEGDNFILVAKNDHVKSTVNTRYIGKIAGAFKAVYGKEYNIDIVLENEVSDTQTKARTKNPDLEGTNLIPKFHFDTFVKGKCNEFAYSASKAAAERPGSQYNPLFIHGDVGLGKTHLMHSIGNFVLMNNPSAKVLYTTSENLVNEFVYSIRTKKNQEFRDKYRKVDVLLVDDIQFLTDKEGTQEEFFHTFNTLHNGHKQIVLTSDRHPSELKSLDDRLRSRFGSGLPVDISAPDFETRTAILQKKVEIDRLVVDSSVINFIAKYIHSNIRELEGALNAVTARAKLTGSECTVEFAESSLEEILKQKEKKEVDVSYIQEVVAGYYGVNTNDLLGKRRTADIIRARHIAMYLCRMLIDKPLKNIGKDFGGKDHTTIIHAVDKITLNMEKDKVLKKEITELERKIKV
ncbi:MAG: chromosomal replication initiator protein DnaA [Defluviitaleaceae bacterium]|nr:chromosomal replication initiator protein DnaA [Defluviitaleaceae bacterium]